MAISAEKKRTKTLDGNDLRRAFADATRFLEKYKDVINALNVFPVPDGDTGTNLLLTMTSVNAEAVLADGTSAEAVSAAMAKGALLGARGNSGVILSQFLQGLAAGFKGIGEFNGKELAHALDMANHAAYRAVSKPVEGTMLTVIRELADAAKAQAEADDGDVVAVWESALKAAREAVSKTPLQLPVLKEAGVVDAGGQGMAVILEGALRFLREDRREEIDLAIPVPEARSRSGRKAVAPSKEFLAASDGEVYGYEAQFILQGKELDVDAIRARVNALGESVVVTGDKELVKVHVHTPDPGAVLSYAAALGTLRQVTVENLDAQHEEFVSQHMKGHETREVDILTVTWGEGFTRVFQSLGVQGIVPTGKVMNPSAREILAHIEALAAKQVVVLPNNPNVIPVAQQAAALASKPVHVIKSRTLPQGISALLAFNPDQTIKNNLAAMKKALTSVSTVAITRAIRSTSVKGIKVRKGGFIGLVDDDLVCSGRSASKVLLEALAHANARLGSLVTLYWGNGVDQSDADKVAKQIRKDYPNLEVEVLWGAQPLYQYIVSVE